MPSLALMPVPPTPAGLHIHLVPAGPTARFALWLEGYPNPSHFQQTLTQTRPTPHPGCLGTQERPPWLPETAVRVEFGVNVPCLSNGHPVPLPGAMLGWQLGSFSPHGRTIAERSALVTGWTLPPSLSLGPLRRLLLSYRDRHGPGFVAPGASAVIAFIDDALAALRDGPLLPTLTLPAAPQGDSGAGWSVGPRSEQPLAWVPPISIDELDRLGAMLARAPRLCAPERGLPRFARFLVEILDAAHARPPDPGEPWTEPRLREGLAAGAAALTELHRAHGSCLYPRHPIFSPPAAPPGHLAGRVDSAGTEARADRPLRLSIGVEDGESFLPLRTLLARGALRARALEHDDHIWFRPGAVIARDWAAMSARAPAMFRAPEMLVEGSTPISEAESERLLAAGEQEAPGYQMRTFLEGEAEEGVAPAPPTFTCFSAAPGRTGAVRLRVQWAPEGDPEAATAAGGGLTEVYFSAEIALLMGDRDLALDEAEGLLRASNAPLLHAGGIVVYRSSLESAIELARARLKVLAKLETEGRGIRYRAVVEVEDEWSAQPDAPESIFAERWQGFLSRIQGGAGVPELGPPPGFVGALRPYQARGVSWLAFLAGHGVGACLADDMGLGKTIQVLALLCDRRARRREDEREGASLVVCPTSVVTNWAREAARFASGLRVHVHQGPGRAREAERFHGHADASHLVVTSYALARRDQPLFETRLWDLVILDEAQNIKTPDAQQTRAIKALRARARLALTGTPVENHLRDLWSIFDFVEPGLLGGAARFSRSFSAPIRAGNEAALARLTRRVGPLLLRRTKRDPEIARDLPEKQEQEVQCELGREQAALYRAMAEAALRGLEDKTGMVRRAHILTALLRLKQICNHPECFAVEEPDRLFGRSGKLDRLAELMAELLAEAQPALVFTQFAETGALLVRALEQRFDLRAPFFHGGLSPDERERMVADFQSPDGPPLLILSLRAGGTGINLTRATAVIHYDRWWNPAVEDQATDRAHRIGQQQRVNVFKLVTRGTLEERLSRMLDDKRDLARKVLGGADDGWLTELDDDALRELLELGDVGGDEAEEAR